MALRIILLGFITIMIYRFLSKFVLPILRAMRAASQRLRDMQQQMENMHQQQQPHVHTQSGQSREGDYIDYEEVK